MKKIYFILTTLCLFLLGCEEPKIFYPASNAEIINTKDKIGSYQILLYSDCVELRCIPGVRLRNKLTSTDSSKNGTRYFFYGTHMMTIKEDSVTYLNVSMFY